MANFCQLIFWLAAKIKLFSQLEALSMIIQLPVFLIYLSAIFNTGYVYFYKNIYIFSEIAEIDIDYVDVWLCQKNQK